MHAIELLISPSPFMPPNSSPLYHQLLPLHATQLLPSLPSAPPLLCHPTPPLSTISPSPFMPPNSFPLYHQPLPLCGTQPLPSLPSAPPPLWHPTPPLSTIKSSPFLPHSSPLHPPTSPLHNHPPCPSPSPPFLPLSL